MHGFISILGAGIFSRFLAEQLPRIGVSRWVWLLVCLLLCAGNLLLLLDLTTTSEAVEAGLPERA